MAELPEPELDPESARAFERGVAEFNAGRFFECHDTLEEIWRGVRGPARDFFQGLIQVSVAFYHLRNANLLGARSQLERGAGKLASYPDAYAGLRLDLLRGELEAWRRRLDSSAPLEVRLDELPKYRLQARDRPGPPPA